MTNMSEDDAIQILYDYLCKTHTKFSSIGAIGIPDKEFFAIETLLGLYKQEKEKNSKLQKRNDKQFRLLRKKDKEIQEIKDISEHDWEERCRLTFKLEDYISKDKIREKIKELENKYEEMGEYSLLRESITYEIKPLKELLEEK